MRKQRGWTQKMREKRAARERVEGGAVVLAVRKPKLFNSKGNLRR